MGGVGAPSFRKRYWVVSPILQFTVKGKVITNYEKDKECSNDPAIKRLKARLLNLSNRLCYNFDH
jgi:hypothetical protein